MMLLSATLARIRADRNISYLRMALIKGYLARKRRLTNPTDPEVTMSLNPSSKEPAYLLGRLFALLEKAQKDAIPGAKATIKDRYFGAASATPGAVFPQLMRLTQHHIRKVSKEKPQFAHGVERRIAEVMDGLETFPSHLNLEQQGRFALGYYHQRVALYTKNPEKIETLPTENAEEDQP